MRNYNAELNELTEYVTVERNADGKYDGSGS